MGDAAFCSALLPGTQTCICPNTSAPLRLPTQTNEGAAWFASISRREGDPAFRIPPCQACSPQLAPGQISGFGLCVCALVCAFNSLCSLSRKLICVRRSVFVLPLLFGGQGLEDAVDSISCSYCPAPLVPQLYEPGAALTQAASK